MTNDAVHSAWLRSVLSAILVIGCGGDNESAVTTRADAIVGGSPASDEAVVALTHNGKAFCTGTLVSSRVVVTAGHCVHEKFAGIASNEIEVFFGSEIGAVQGQFVAVEEANPHPEFDPDGAYDLDIGVVKLAEVAPAKPVPLLTQPFTSAFKGAEVRLVGFGITGLGATDSGVKRQTKSKILAYGQFQFELLYQPSGVCNGDSGGPALLMHDGHEVIAGIHSQGDCQSIMYEERVDAHSADFVQPFVDAAEGTGGAGGSTQTGGTASGGRPPNAGGGGAAGAASGSTGGAAGSNVSAVATSHSNDEGGCRVARGRYDDRSITLLVLLATLVGRTAMRRRFRRASTCPLEA